MRPMQRDEGKRRLGTCRGKWACGGCTGLSLMLDGAGDESEDEDECFECGAGEDSEEEDDVRALTCSSPSVACLDWSSTMDMAFSLHATSDLMMETMLSRPSILSVASC